MAQRKITFTYPADRLRALGIDLAEINGAVIPFRADGFGGKFKVVRVDLVDDTYRVLVVIMQ